MWNSQRPGLRSSGTILVSPAFWAKVGPGKPISGGRKRQDPTPTTKKRMKSLGRDHMRCLPLGWAGGAGPTTWQTRVNDTPRQREFSRDLASNGGLDRVRRGPGNAVEIAGNGRKRGMRIVLAYRFGAS